DSCRNNSYEAMNTTAADQAQTSAWSNTRPFRFPLVVASLVASLWCRWLRASCMPGAEDFRAEASIVRIKTPTLWQITGHRQQAHRPSKATRNQPALKRAITCNNVQ